MIGLALVHRLVADHGDALRFSLSKKGRIWLTLTHWDSEKYNTSVELDSFSEVQDVLNALAVVGVAHYGKCFRSMAHADSWHGVDATRSLVDDCIVQCREYMQLGANGQSAPEGQAEDVRSTST